MLTKEEFKIIEFFAQNISKNYTIKEIMKSISKKSYAWTYNALKHLNKKDIINIEKKGNLKLCSLNLYNDTLKYLALAELKKANAKKLPKKNIEKLIESVPIDYFIFIVTGSYAKGQATKNSDLDIVVIIEDKINKNQILNTLKNQGELMIPEVHPYVFSKSEFVEMLLNHEENYGKILFKNHLILFGAENFYRIIKTAINKGFSG